MNTKAGLRMRTLSAVLALSTASLVSAGLPAGAAATPRAGATIRVATIGDFQANGADNRQWIDAVQARFQAANASGGLVDAHGLRHKVVVVVCNAASDPDQTTKCARQAVARRVVAVVGMSLVYSDRALAILDAAGIAAIGVRVNTGADATSAASFPLASGFTAQMMAMPELLALQGAKKIAVIISDFGSATDDALGVLARGLALTSAAQGPTVRVPPGTTSFSAAAAAAAQPGVDGIVGFVGGGDAGALAQQLRASNYAGMYVTQAPWGTAAAASDVSISIDGTLVVGQFVPATCDVRAWKQIRRDMQAYKRSSASLNEGAVNYWLAARVFEHVVRDVDLTRISGPALETLIYDSNNDTGGLTPPLERSDANPDFPRLVNRTVTFSKTSGGKVRLLTPRFFDPFTGHYLTQASAVALRSCRS
ncbi:MAG: branched-chain amino acid transport system substrate-binding protein [Actinomycetota bacterium]|nr:branched-chain amino acid transport system substrate-binding protein [Actinomycetota bacterium]